MSLCRYSFERNRWEMGMEDMGDGLGPWIPGPDELAAIREDLEVALKEDYRVLVHPLGVKITPITAVPYSDWFREWIYEYGWDDDLDYSDPVRQIAYEAKVRMAERLGVSYPEGP